MPPDGIDLILTAPARCAGAARHALPGWLAALKRSGRDFGVTVVDDGTPENLADLAGDAVTVLRHDAPRGFGACLRTGLSAGSRPVVASAACDYPYTPGDLTLMLERLDFTDPEAAARTALVAGCRGGRPAPPLAAAVGTLFRLASLVAVGMPLARPPGWLGVRGHLRSWRGWFVYGTPFIDTDSTFFVARRAALERFPIQSDGGFAPTEIAGKLTFLTHYLDEVPLTPKPDALPEADWADARELFRRPDFGPPTPVGG